MELTTTEIFKLAVPIVLIGLSFIARKNPKFEGKIIKWWVMLVLGLILLVLRILSTFVLK